MSLEAFFEAISLQERRRQIYRAEYYKPYEYQKKFHHATGYGTQKLAMLRALLAGNQTGKTYCGCMEDSYHLTGIYPDWWRGHRFGEPINLLAAGLTNESVRDILQREMLGDPTDEKLKGTGTIPIDKIGKINRKAGVPNAIDSVKVKHITGRWSNCYFRAYEQGWKKFMGVRYEVVHSDEEPPEEVWEQMLRSMFSRKYAIGYITFTPEEGMTKVVDRFMNHPTEGTALINAGWTDAEHMMKDGELTERAKIFAANIPKHSLEMRTKGIPLSGSGLIYGVADEEMLVKPFQIPPHWPQLVGMDFGWDHPASAVRIVWDRDSDCVYLVNEHRLANALPAIHVQAIQAWGKWVPVAWPHDGLQHDKGSGEELIAQYRKLGLNALPNKATLPPDAGKEEGAGGNSVEAGIMDILARMETGRFKVFNTCTMFMEEKRMYHRKDGKIVKLNDDICDALRYAVMMLRHAKTNTNVVQGHTSVTRWGEKYLSAMPQRRVRI